MIKTHLQQNSMNPVKKAPKTVQNGKGPPPPQEPHGGAGKPHSQAPPPPATAKNRGRRRSRGGRKFDQGDVMMRPTCRPCTVANKPLASSNTANGSAENGGNNNNNNNTCDLVMGFPTSSKSLSFAPRPGYGQVGTKCLVKANHFFAELPDKDLNQYDVSETALYSGKKLIGSLMTVLFSTFFLLYVLFNCRWEIE